MGLEHTFREKDFNEIEIGESVEFEEMVDLQRHLLFMELFKDYSPIHNDSNFAKDTRFQNVIGYGFMLNGFLSKLYGEYLPGGNSICVKQESNFKKPFYIGEKIKICGKVIEKIESTKLLVIESKMYRNGTECIFTGKGTVQVLFNKKDCIPLYKKESDYIYYKDFVWALKEVGIEKGDTLFIHTDITKFGKLVSNDRNYLFKSIIKAFETVIGKSGTIMMPAFSYSFCKNEIYDINDTKGTVGVLNEYFRKLPDSVRTKHPIFSVAVNGRNKENFLNIDNDSFGEKSIFAKLHQCGGKLVFFGASFDSCTYLHYIEQMHGVPYRYMKVFNGKVKDGDKIYDDQCSFFVRYLDRDVILDVTKLENYLLERGFMKKASIGFGDIITIDAKILYDEGFKLLQKDLNYFLKEN